MTNTDGVSLPIPITKEAAREWTALAKAMGVTRGDLVVSAMEIAYGANLSAIRSLADTGKQNYQSAK
jgi:hypothetical protein